MFRADSGEDEIRLVAVLKASCAIAPAPGCKVEGGDEPGLSILPAGRVRWSETGSGQAYGKLKNYNGRTGVIFNVTKTAVGVICKKIVREKQLQKRILVRLEHVKMSSAREEITQRTIDNETYKKQVRAGKAGS